MTRVVAVSVREIPKSASPGERFVRSPVHEEHVFRLDVTVYQTVLMRGIERGRDLLGDAQSHVDRQWPTVAEPLS